MSSRAPAIRPNPHRLAEERSIALHAAIAEALETDESILERARDRVEGWLGDRTVHESYAARWKELLELPPEVLAVRLVDPGEEMRALRQCSPFAGALDPRTRWRILREVSRSPEPR